MTAPAPPHVVPTQAGVPPAALAPVLPAPGIEGNCTASPRNTTPGDGGDETITVHTSARASVNLQVHYKTTTHSFSDIADSTGTAVITFSIGRPTPGYTVEVNVSTGSGQACSTQFTPQ